MINFKGKMSFKNYGKNIEILFRMLFWHIDNNS